MALVLTTTRDVVIKKVTNSSDYIVATLEVTVPGPIVKYYSKPEEKQPDQIVTIALSEQDLDDLVYILRG